MRALAVVTVIASAALGFYRARYDAARMIDAFAVRLRGDVDLDPDPVRTDLISVVHDTIHPAHAIVWLRSGRG